MSKFVVFLLLLVLSISACPAGPNKEESKDKTGANKEAEIEKTVIARVDGNPIYKEDLAGRSLEDAIADEVLYKVALKNGMDKKLEQEIESYKRRLVLNDIKKEIIGSIPKEEAVSDQEIENYYKENEEKYALLDLQELTVQDKQLAEQILKRAHTGEDLEKIASEIPGVRIKTLRYNRKYSKLFVGKGKGALSDIIQEGENEFKILKLSDVRKVTVQQAKQAIRYTLLAQKTNEAMRTRAEKLKQENNVKVEILDTKPE